MVTLPNKNDYIAIHAHSECFKRRMGREFANFIRIQKQDDTLLDVCVICEDSCSQYLICHTLSIIYSRFYRGVEDKPFKVDKTRATQ